MWKCGTKGNCRTQPQRQKCTHCVHVSICVCLSWAGVMLIISVWLQFQWMTPERNPTKRPTAAMRKLWMQLGLHKTQLSPEGHSDDSQRAGVNARWRSSRIQKGNTKRGFHWKSSSPTARRKRISSWCVSDGKEGRKGGVGYYTKMRLHEAPVYTSGCKQHLLTSLTLTAENLPESPHILNIWFL